MIPSLMTQGGSKLSWITAICIVTLGHVAPRESFSQDTAAIPRYQVTREMHRAVSFFRKHASAGGGYVYQLSADLAKREGEGKARMLFPPVFASRLILKRSPSHWITQTRPTPKGRKRKHWK